MTLHIQDLWWACWQGTHPVQQQARQEVLPYALEETFLVFAPVLQLLRCPLKRVCHMSLLAGHKEAGMRVHQNLANGHLGPIRYRQAACNGNDMLQVRETGDRRGRGAFAVQDIPAGTVLGWYQGDLLNEQEYWRRYPSGIVSTAQPCSQPHERLGRTCMFCKR